MMTTTLIRTSEELEKLRHRAERRGIRSVTLAMHGDSVLLRRAERRINRNLHPCGCELAALLLSAVLVVSGAFCLSSFVAGRPLTSNHFWRIAEAVIAAVLLGKGIGTVLGELILARAITDALQICRHTWASVREHGTDATRPGLQAGSIVVIAAILACFGSAIVYAQQPPDRSASTLEDLKKSDVLASRLTTLRGRIERKRTQLSHLEQRLVKARALDDTRIRQHTISRYSYQRFLITAQLASEENKLKETEAMVSAFSRPDASDSAELLKKMTAAAVKARISVTEGLLVRADAYGRSISERTFKGQFDALVAAIRQDRDRLRKQQ